MSEFFEGIRPQVYFDGGRLYLDKKTGKRMWQLKLAIDLDADSAATCDGPVLANYIAIETTSNSIEEILLAYTVPTTDVDFYALGTGAESLLWQRAELTDLRFTREKDLTTLHFKMDVRYGPMVHQFIGEHTFTKLWAEFKPAQPMLASGKPQLIDSPDKRPN